MDKIEIINNFEEIIKEINRLDNNDCNVFRILGCGRNELKHSYFIRWMLYNNTFFDYFTKRCGIDLKDEQILEERKIIREDTYTTNEGGDLKNPLIRRDLYYTENKVFRHIDLNIIGDTYSITIENKVDSGQHDDQCISYYNYMNDPECKHYKNAKGKIRDKYFVFLAKDEPKDYEYYGGLIPFKNNDKKYTVKKEHTVKEYEDEYDRNEKKKLIFFNYRLITYENIRQDIFQNPQFIKEYEDDQKKNEKYEFAREILTQYEGLLNEFNEMNPQYYNVFENMSRKQEKIFYQIIEKMEDLQQGEEDTDFGRFLEVAQEYYLAKKRKYDELIIPALESIISEYVGIKSDYGRGGYANAIPISTCNLGNEDLVCLLKKVIHNNGDNERERHNKYVELLDSSRKLRDYTSKQEVLLKELEEVHYKKRILNKIENEYNQTRKISDEHKEYKELIQKYLLNKKALDDVTMIIDQLGYGNIKKNEEEKFGCVPNSSNTMLQTVDFRAPMGGRENITVAIVAGLNKDYSTNLCKKVLSDSQIKDVFEDNNHNYDELSWSLSIKNGSGFAKDRKVIPANLVKFYEKFLSHKNSDNAVLQKKLYIGTTKFEDIFSDGYITFFEDLVKGGVVAESDAKEMMEYILMYFVGLDNPPKNVLLKYEKEAETGKKVLKVKDEQKTCVDTFFKKVQELVGNDVLKYKDGIEKKFCLKNIGGDWGNRQINCLWNLDILFELKNTNYENKDELAEIFRQCTLEGVKLFGYKDYFVNHILN